MGKGSLGLYRQHDNAGKRWLAVRNLTGKVMFSAGVVPQMNFTAMDKAASVVFACRPVFGACVGPLAASCGADVCVIECKQTGGLAHD